MPLSKPIDPKSALIRDSVPLGSGGVVDPSTPGYAPPSPWGEGTLDEMGITGGERLMHNILREPHQYAEYLRSREYQVEAIPDLPGVLKVRHNANEPWRVTDRAQNDKGEWMYDIGDFAGDALVGGLSALGAVVGGGLGVAGGPLAATGAIGGAGVGAAAGEAVLQGAAALTGFSEEMDPGAITAAGVVGAVGEGAFQVGGAVLNAGGRGFLQSGATMAGIRPMGDLPPRKVLLELAMEQNPPRRWWGMPRLGQATRNFSEASEPVRAMLAQIKSEGVLPETQAIRDMLQEATDANVTLSLGEFENFLRSHGTIAGKPVKTTTRTPIEVINEYTSTKSAMKSARSARYASRAEQEAGAPRVVGSQYGPVATDSVEEGISGELAAALNVSDSTFARTTRQGVTTRTTTKAGQRLAASSEATLLSSSERKAIDAFIIDVESNVLEPAGETWKSMSPSTADHIRKMARNAARSARAFNVVGERMTPIETELGRVLSQGYHKVRTSLDTVMEAQPNAQIYSELRFTQKQKMDSLDVLRDFFGKSDQDIANGARALYGTTNFQPTVLAVTDALRAYGIDATWIKRSAMQEAATGFPTEAISAMPFSGIKSPSLQMGLLAGTAGYSLSQRAAGIPAGALALSSPQVLLHLVRQGANISELARAFGGAPLRGGEQAAISASRPAWPAWGGVEDGIEADLSATPGVATQDAPVRSKRVADLTSGY